MIKVPKKGSVVWHDLYPDISEQEMYKGVQVGIQHVGPVVARVWSCKNLQVQLREAKRLADLRSGTDKESCPSLWSTATDTPEGVQEALDFIDEVFRECVTGVRGVDDIDGTDKEACLDFLSYLEVGEAMRLMHAAFAQQTLKPHQKFSSASPGDMEPGDPA